MQIVLVHYHLNTGGVTQVIINQLRSLAKLEGSLQPERVGVLCGDRQDGWPAELWGDVSPPDAEPLDVTLMSVSTMDYDPLPNLREDELANEIACALEANGFAPDDTLLHIHNHALGKNASWPGAIARLAVRGYRMLLELHDFVEDFRPANYRHLANAWQTDNPQKLADKQYLTGTGIHYATLTGRDHKLLHLAGIDDERLHILPNPVAEFPGSRTYEQVARSTRSQLGIPETANLVLYPVRGIRRKNLGELLLHAAISSSDCWHALTLAPKNPLEISSYERWRALASDLKLRCLMNTCGAKTSEFLDILAAADSLITTSVAEGFGMVFLEAWLAGKPLTGRDLPGITSEFRAAGLQLDNLYEALYIPLDLIEHHHNLAEALSVAYQWACDGYGVTLNSKAEIDQTIEELLADEKIDFALLPSRFQEQVITTAAHESDHVRQTLHVLNPKLSNRPTAGDKHVEATIAENADVVRREYSLATIGKKLGKTYQMVWSDEKPKEITPASDGSAVLQQFLRLERLHAIRFEE